MDYRNCKSSTQSQRLTFIVFRDIIHLRLFNNTTPKKRRLSVSDESQIYVRFCMHCKDIFGCVDNGITQTCIACEKKSTCIFHMIDLMLITKCTSCTSFKTCTKRSQQITHQTGCLTCFGRGNCSEYFSRRFHDHDISHGFCSEQCTYNQYPELKFI